MCNLQKRLIRAAFWVFTQAMFTERLKTNGTAIKITRETTNNQQKKYNSCETYTEKTIFIHEDKY